MSRQPYLPQYAALSDYAVGPSCLERRPEHAALIGRCMAMWAEAELQLALVLAALLNTRTDPAMAVFTALRNARAQRDVIVAAAARFLVGNSLKAFNAVMALHKALDSERSALAHGIYGCSDEVPDAIFWIGMTDYAHFLLDDYRTDGKKVDRHAMMKERLYVYRLKDLQEILANITQFQRASFLLHLSVRNAPNDEGNREFQALCSLPQIRAELNR